jgi:hypothetical protein
MAIQNSGAFPATLVTAAPENGLALSIMLSGLAVKAEQPNIDTLKYLRPDNANNADSIIAVSDVVGVHFSTSGQANQYWPESGENT